MSKAIWTGRVSNRSTLIALIALGLPALFFSMAALMLPLLPEWLSDPVDGVLGITCHRLPGRLIMLPWGNTGLCVRCTAFWGGILLACVAQGIMRRTLRSFFPGVLLAVPAAVDILLARLLPWSGDNLLRLVTGFLAGTGFALVLWPGRGGPRKGGSAIAG